MHDFEARRSLGWLNNEIECKHVHDDGRACIGNVFTVYKDEAGKISLVCHWGHITTIFEGHNSTGKVEEG